MAANALIHEKSPYLRQHAGNPVDWLPWGEVAFEKARMENKPIFLSIGYSTCHWCHVMAHESFEDPATAEVLNREFVPVKLDREERPDVDRIYMLFVQATTGSGGWPMSVWLTPDLKPFFGGTYFPPDSRYGRPGFRDVLEYLGRAWKQDRQKVESSGANVVEQLRAMSEGRKGAAALDEDLFAAAYWQLRRSFDARWGGFGGAPKFPRPVALNYLLRYFARVHNDEALDMVTKTLRGMAAGGMHDHLGGGFHRYSVDERWFVPHFEKMLYDHAQLAISYLEAFQITKRPHFADVARGIFSYVLRDMTSAEGAFYSAEDADSPDPENPSHAGEGAFYIWRKTEIVALLGPEDARSFCELYGVRENGNVEHDPQEEFAGRNILFRELTDKDAAPNAAFERSRNALFEARAKRPRPHLDSKILTSWNALMISALVTGYRVLDEPAYLDAARRAAAFLIHSMYDPSSGRLLRRYCDGEGAVSGFLDDYAFLAQAHLDLFEATFDPDYLERALDFVRRGFPTFEDGEAGGFFSTAGNAPDLLLRLKDDYDGAEPSGSSVATDVLIRLADLTGDQNFRAQAETGLRAAASSMRAQPTMAPQMLVALARWLAGPQHVVIRSAAMTPETDELVREYWSKFTPDLVLLAFDDTRASKLASCAPFLGTLERKSRITIYDCKDFACRLPRNID